MKKKSTLLVTLLIIFTAAVKGPARADDRVRIEVDVIYASNKDRPTESSLSYLKDQLQTFNFSSYSLLQRKWLTLSTGKSGGLDIPGGRYLSIELEEVREGRAKLMVKVSDRSQQLLSTMFSIAPGQTVLVGGPTYESGSLIIAIKARF